MLFNSPLFPDKANRLIDLLNLTPNDRVLDIGCGTGEFLIRVIEASNASGVGIDIDSESIEQAIEATRGRIGGRTHEFRVVDATTASFDEHSFDVAICLGSTHAFASGEAAYPTAIDRMRQWVKPGGLLLLGEGFWKEPPDEEYREFIGDPVGVYHNHAGNVTLANDKGLTPLYAAVSSDDEWDHFEWSHALRIERAATESSDDPATAERLERSRSWREAYLRWGRTTMGFGFYLFRNG